AERFLDALDLFTQAVSLGDVESLATHPASTTHQLVGPEVRERHGITAGLVRLSVGIEDGRDLLDDVLRALDGLAGRESAGAPPSVAASRWSSG
ncbi:MAG TPA: PLP-dependent transferase, partial [Trueperaceae bacterium]|nr:PLP-dependent transferase [Trueperaceae bacterium]